MDNAQSAERDDHTVLIVIVVVVVVALISLVKAVRRTSMGSDYHVQSTHQSLFFLVRSKIKNKSVRPSLMGSELRCQNFDLVKFREIMPRNPCYGTFFLKTLSQNPRKFLIRRLSPSLSQNFGQILTRALGLTALSELHLEVVRRVLKKYTWQRERQQTLAFRHRRRRPTELGYRGECPAYRPLPMLSLSLSIWRDSAFRDVANF